MMETGSTYDEFKILSIDGGGIKGLFSACVLHEIERANGRLTDHFDMLCGTSTGGLIALGLAAGKLAGEIVLVLQGVGINDLSPCRLVPPPAPRCRFLRWRR